MLSSTGATKRILQVFNHSFFNINFVTFVVHATRTAYFNAHDFITPVTTAADYDASEHEVFSTLLLPALSWVQIFSSPQKFY